MQTAFLSPQFAQAEINDPRFQLAQSLIGNAISNQGTPADGTGIGAIAHGVNGLLGGYLNNQVRQQYANQQQGANDTRALAYQLGMGQQAEGQDYTDGTHIDWDAQPGNIQAMISTLASNPYTADEAQGLQKQAITSQLTNQAALALKRQEIALAADPANMSAADKQKYQLEASEQIPNPSGFGTIAKYGAAAAGAANPTGTISGMYNAPVSGVPTPQVQTGNLPAGATGADIAAGTTQSAQSQPTGKSIYDNGSPENNFNVPPNLTGQAALDYIRQTTSPSFANMLQQTGQGDTKYLDSSRSGLDKFSQTAIQHLAAQIYPNLNQTQTNYANKVKTQADFKTGEAATSARALGTASNHLAHLTDQIGDTSSGSLTPVNWLSNEASSLTGGHGATQFNQTADALAGELGTVYKGSGHNSDTEIRDMRSHFSPNASADQKYSALWNGLQLMNGRATELAHQYNSGLNLSPGSAGYKGANDFLSPQAQANVAKAQNAITKFYAANPGIKPPTGLTLPSQSNTATSAKINAVPAAGTVYKGYVFKGGDPSNQANWLKAS